MKKKTYNNKFSTLPINEGSKKNKTKKFGKGLMLFVATLLGGLSGIPTEEPKNQAEIQQSVELLEANDIYYSLVNTMIYDVTGKKIEEVKYNPLVLPKGTKTVKVIVDKKINKECQQAVKDSLEEYNSVLKAANQDFKFKFYSEYTLPDVCDIVVKPMSSNQTQGIHLGLPLANGSRTFNQIFVDKSCTEYNKFLITFSHELMHYFGAGDLYTLSEKDKNSVDSIMNFPYTTVNALKSNDIKYLFATLDDIKTQADVKRVNNYIDYHLTKYSYANQQAEKLKSKFGEKCLLDQIKQYTKLDENVSLKTVDLQNELFLVDKKNYLTSKKLINSNIGGLNLNNLYCSYLDSTNKNILVEQYSRKFFKDYVLYNLGEKYALFNNNGKLINIYQSVTESTYDKYKFWMEIDVQNKFAKEEETL